MTTIAQDVPQIDVTAFKSKNDNPEKSIADFYKNEILTDMTIVNSLNNSRTQIHKVVLASGSQYFLKVFKETKIDDFIKEAKDAKPGDLQFSEIEIPKPVKTFQSEDKIVSDEHINRILKYIYHNQDFSVIKGELNPENVYSFYAQADIMECIHLKKDLEDFIIKDLLKPENATQTAPQVYLEAISFDSKKLAEACEVLLQKNIDKILETDESSAFLLSLPFKYIRSLCDSNKLNIRDEKVLLNLFEKYLKLRESLPLLPEEIPKSNLDDLLTEEEKKSRAEKATKEAEEKKKIQEEEQKKKEAEEATYTPLQKINNHWSKKVAEEHDKQNNRLKICRLTKAEKIELFRTVRYSFMSHEDLILLTSNKTFELAKDFILEGLSARLNNFENAIKTELKINTEPRVNYEPSKGVKLTSINGSGNYESYYERKLAEERKAQQEFTGKLFQEKIGNKIQDKMHEAKEHQELLQLNKLQSLLASQQLSLTPAQLQILQGAQKTTPGQQGISDQHLSVGQWQQLLASHGQAMTAHQQQALTAKPQLGQSNLFAVTQNHFKSQQLQDSLPSAFNTMTNLKQQGFPMKPMKPHNEQYLDVQSQLQQRPVEFVFGNHFDEDGALFFLGSFGKKRLHQNPHTLGQVQAFSSSIGSGRPEDIVGRQVVNCRTGNEPFSYFGVDLGEARQLLPTCYSIRNRNLTTHVLLNWHFEGSNDRVNWTVLDRRLYSTGNPAEDDGFEEEKKMLCSKGAATTWGIDTDIYREIGFDGFRYFRIVQVGKNSSGSDNLALSGLELYGRVISGRWP